MGSHSCLLLNLLRESCSCRSCSHCCLLCRKSESSSGVSSKLRLFILTFHETSAFLEVLEETLSFESLQLLLICNIGS